MITYTTSFFSGGLRMLQATASNLFTSRKRREYSQCNVPLVPASIYGFWLPYFSVRVCVCVFFRWMFGAPTVNYGNKTNKCIESFTGILGPTRLNAFVGFTAIRNKLKAWSWIAENYFKNNLPSKGIQVCTKGEEDQMRWHSSLTQLYIAKRSCIIPQLPVSA